MNTNVEEKINQSKNKFQHEKEIYLRIKVHPGARKSEVTGILNDEENGETFKIDIAAVAAKGKANIELINFLAKEFKISRSNIKIISGAGDRIKLVKITSN